MKLGQCPPSFSTNNKLVQYVHLPTCLVNDFMFKCAVEITPGIDRTEVILLFV